MAAGLITAGSGWLTQLVAGAGGGALVAISLFKFLGERWLDSKIKARADADKHRRDQEIEALRARISRQFDRVTKLSNREFDVLPQIWALIVDAYSAAEAASMRLRRRPDLTRMGEADIGKLLDRDEIFGTVRDEIFSHEGDERNRRYWHLLDLIQANQVKQKAAEAHFALSKNGIFLSEALRAQLEEAKEFVWEAAVDIVLDVEHPLRGERIPDRPIDRFRAGGFAKLRETEVVVRQTLRAATDDADSRDG